jgi:hypothetical protein
MSRFIKLCLPVSASLWALAAVPQEIPPVYDRVTLNVTAERQVENDIMVAVVYAEVEANNQARAADDVNQAIRYAADRAAATSSGRCATRRAPSMRTTGVSSRGSRASHSGSSRKTRPRSAPCSARFRRALPSSRWDRASRELRAIPSKTR